MSKTTPQKPPLSAAYNVQMTFRIPSVLANKVKAEARRLHAKPSEVLRRIIFDHLAAIEAAKPSKPLKS